MGGLQTLFGHLYIDRTLVSFRPRQHTDLSEKKSLLSFPKALPNVLVYHLTGGCLFLAGIQS